MKIVSCPANRIKVEERAAEDEMDVAPPRIRLGYWCLFFAYCCTASPPPSHTIHIRR